MRVNELRADFERGAKIVKEKKHDKYLGENNVCFLGTIVVGAASRELGTKSYKKIRKALVGEGPNTGVNGCMIREAIHRVYDVHHHMLYEAESAFEWDGMSRKKVLKEFFPAEEEAPADEPDDDGEVEVEEEEELVEV